MRCFLKPAVLNPGDGDYDGNPFDVTAYVKNIGSSPLNNVHINIAFDDDMLKLEDGEDVKTLDKLNPDEETAVQWTVRATPQNTESTAHYRITGSYDGAEPQVAELETVLTELPRFHTVSFHIREEGGDTVIASFPVEDGGSFAESDIPFVPGKEPQGNVHYEGKWDFDPAMLTNITSDVDIYCVYTEIISVESLSISPAEAELHIGSEDTVELVAEILPENAADKTVTWVSYNTDVATVSENGLVSAVNVGTATIAATSNADPSVSAVCAVTVKADLTGIKVTAPELWEMMQGSPLDITGLVVKAVYSNGDEKEINDYTLTGYDPNPEGLGFGELDEEGQTVGELEYVDETLTVSYEDVEPQMCTVRVKRSPKELTAIHIRRPPDKRLDYVVGDELNLKGMIVNLVYNDNKGPVAAPAFANGKIPDGFEITGYNPKRVGNQAITVSYGGKSMQFSIRVLPAENTPLDENNLIQPRVSIESGLGYKMVSLSSAEGDVIPSGIIYYTTDGTVPTSSSKRYTEPFRLEETATVKAIAISGSQKSAITSSLVSLPQASAPIVANPHHRNNQGPNGGMTELEPGTLVSFRSDTSGASIFYWIEGQLGSSEESRYGTSVYMKPDYADDNGNVVVKAYATKDGYSNSTVTTMRYHLNIPETIPETATLSVGTVSSRAGEIVSPTLSINTTGSGNITNFSVKIAYNSGVFEFISANSLTDNVQVFYSNRTSGREGEVTVQYNGDTELPTGEVCALNFRAYDSTEDQSYNLKLNQESVLVGTTSARAMIYYFADGEIVLFGSHNSQLTASTGIVDANGDPISSVDKLEPGSEFQATVTIELPEGYTENGELASLYAADGGLRVLNVFLAIYDSNEAMVSLEAWDIDVTDPTSLHSVRSIRVNRRVSGGRARFMIMGNDLNPETAANIL